LNNDDSTLDDTERPDNIETITPSAVAVLSYANGRQRQLSDMSAVRTRRRCRSEGTTVACDYRYRNTSKSSLQPSGECTSVRRRQRRSDTDTTNGRVRT